MYMCAYICTHLCLFVGFAQVEMENDIDFGLKEM